MSECLFISCPHLSLNSPFIYSLVCLIKNYWPGPKAQTWTHTVRHSGPGHTQWNGIKRNRCARRGFHSHRVLKQWDEELLIGSQQYNNNLISINAPELKGLNSSQCVHSEWLSFLQIRQVNVPVSDTEDFYFWSLISKSGIKTTLKHPVGGGSAGTHWFYGSSCLATSATSKLIYSCIFIYTCLFFCFSLFIFFFFMIFGVPIWFHLWFFNISYYCNY